MTRFGQLIVSGVSIAGLLGAIALLSGCGLGRTATATPAATTPSGSLVAGACTATDVAGAMTAAVTFQNDASSYRTDYSSTVAGLTQTERVDLQRPDRIHVTGRSGGSSFEFIAVGTTLWRKSSGNWVVASSSFDFRSLLEQSGQLNENTVTEATFTKVSVDENTKVDGQPTVLYRFHQSIPSQMEADVQFWLRPDSCEPVKSITTFTAASGGANSGDQRTTAWSTWNSVTILPPV